MNNTEIIKLAIENELSLEEACNKNTQWAINSFITAYDYEINNNIVFSDIDRVLNGVNSHWGALSTFIEMLTDCEKCIDGIIKIENVLDATKFYDEKTASVLDAKWDEALRKISKIRGAVMELIIDTF